MHKSSRYKLSVVYGIVINIFELFCVASRQVMNSIHTKLYWLQWQLLVKLFILINGYANMINV